MKYFKAVRNFWKSMSFQLPIWIICWHVLMMENPIITFCQRNVSYLEVESFCQDSTRAELFLASFCKWLLSIPGSLIFFCLVLFCRHQWLIFIYVHMCWVTFCVLCFFFFNLAIGVVMHCWSYYQSYAGRWVCLFLVLWLSLCSQAHGFASKITKVLQDYLMAH